MAKPNYEKLEEILKDKKEVAILTHANPDPDSIGSALGIQLLFTEQFDIKSEIFYPGQISHDENKSLVHLAGIEIKHIDSFDKEKYQNNVAIIDSSKSKLIENPLIVIDHHDFTEEKEIRAKFKYINKKIGACVTLVLELLSHYEIKLDEKKHKKMITAMVHGLKSDTQNFGPKSNHADVDSFSYLYNLTDLQLLWKIEHPSITPATLETLANAIKNKEVENNYLLSGVGVFTESDSVGTAADYLLIHSGIETTIIYGIVDSCLKASLRTTDQTVNVRELAEKIFGEEYAGGHTTMAGANRPLYYSPELEDEMWGIVTKTTSDNFYKAIKTKKEEK
jgi:nanoRNase/pAp phosphatase (c-di-AMP/oligoRNAs hydrolase)